jgi:hypothetical protein
MSLMPSTLICILFSDMKILALVFIVDPIDDTNFAKQ